jgi:uncharacterized membrane protein YqjE
VALYVGAAAAQAAALLEIGSRGAVPVDDQTLRKISLVLGNFGLIGITVRPLRAVWGNLRWRQVMMAIVVLAVLLEAVVTLSIVEGRPPSWLIDVLHIP